MTRSKTVQTLKTRRKNRLRPHKTTKTSNKAELWYLIDLLYSQTLRGRIGLIFSSRGRLGILAQFFINFAVEPIVSFRAQNN